MGEVYGESKLPGSSPVSPDLPPPPPLLHWDPSASERSTPTGLSTHQESTALPARAPAEDHVGYVMDVVAALPSSRSNHTSRSPPSSRVENGRHDLSSDSGNRSSCSRPGTRDKRSQSQCPGNLSDSVHKTSEHRRDKRVESCSVGPGCGPLPFSSCSKGAEASPRGDPAPRAGSRSSQSRGSNSRDSCSDSIPSLSAGKRHRLRSSELLRISREQGARDESQVCRTHYIDNLRT